MTQEGMILKYMQDYGSINPMQALSDLGCYRLGARIKDLRDKGYNVITERETRKNRYGIPVAFARYRLEKKDES